MQNLPEWNFNKSNPYFAIRSRSIKENSDIHPHFINNYNVDGLDLDGSRQLHEKYYEHSVTNKIAAKIVSV